MAYKHIFFDLDHTIWDFESNSKEALIELYHGFELEKLGEKVNFEDFLTIYYEVNYGLWRLYDLGKIDQHELRYSRFKTVLNKMDVPDHLIPNIQLSDEYLRLTPLKSRLMPYAIEVLEYLQKNYVLHIITNGFADVQDIKLASSGLRPYFDLIVTSENAGYKKPSREIFDYTIRKSKAMRQECLMIGDNLETDIQGAKNAELDHIFYNPLKKTHQEDIQMEIDCLSKLIYIL